MRERGLPPGSVGPFAGLNVPWLLEARAQSRRDHPFVVWVPFEGPSRTWTYGEFAHRVRAIAAGFARRGLGPGDVVMIHLENCVEFLVAWFACAEIGALAVTTNTRAAATEIAYFADRSGAVAAITQSSLADTVASACPHLRWIAVASAGSETSPASARPSWSDTLEAVAVDGDAPPPRRRDPDESCSVQFTSGTTARPKAVVWSHANALWAARVNASHEDLRPEDVHLIYSPLFHTNAMSYSLLATLWAGATAVLMPRFSASRFWAVARHNRCTWGSMTSFSTRALLEHDVPDDHSFRLWGTPLSDSPSLDRFGIKTVGWWGMTETVSHGIVGDPHHVVRPVGIGRPAPEYDVRVTDADGNATTVGETGDLLIRGTPGLSLFKEYLHDAEATRSSFDEHGYFVTGDRVQLLDDGVIRFSDRANNLLRVGGENVAASEIEQVATGVPGVREAAVVGRPHPMLDEVPVVFVIPERGVASAPPRLVEDVLSTCRRDLADFKVPREVKLLDDFPRATLEKVAKRELKKMLDEQ